MFYFDFVSHVRLEAKTGHVVSGASHGTALLLQQILESKYYGAKPITILFHRGFQPGNDVEERFLQAERFKKLFIDRLEDVDYKPGDTLFIPMVCGRDLIRVNALKKRFPFLKLYGRIHDKNHNLPWDWTDRLYASGFGRSGIPQAADWLGKRALYALRYGKWIGNFSKLFTVSNYSLQAVAHKNARFLSYYYQGSVNALDGRASAPGKPESQEPYLLFVDGSRPEKNFLRTAIAFAQYKKTRPESPLRLYAVSMKPKVWTILLKTLRKTPGFREEDFRVFGYVSDEELQSLYAGCQFALFTSKGEGFGLPVLEAILNGRPVLASRRTSIPEVAGPSVRYVNPFDINSIAEGIAYLSEPERLSFYEDAARNRADIVRRIIREDERLFLRELFEE